MKIDNELIWGKIAAGVKNLTNEGKRLRAKWEGGLSAPAVICGTFWLGWA
jgi:hypothetical protein